MRNSDPTIKKLVKTIEQKVPVGVEKKFLEELDRISVSVKASRRKPHTFIKITLATAAGLILAILIFSPIAHDDKNQRSQPAVLVESARIGGEKATTYIFEEKDPELTVVWIEKTGEES